MRPLILTNAFLRPRATRTSKGVFLAEDNYGVYACIEEMIAVITQQIEACPLILPTSHDPEAIASLLDRIDGIFLPGAVSNMDPALYGEKPSPHPQIFDAKHDATDIFLATQARQRNIPYFGICRAMQAMNVAFGGSLGQKIVSEQLDHACSYPCDGRNEDERYMHSVDIAPGGMLDRLFGKSSIKVNSMHEQHVLHLGKGVRLEARAPDDIVEAISLTDHPFFLGVQWHPEAMPENAVSRVLFDAFSQAVRQRASLKRVA